MKQTFALTMLALILSACGSVAPTPVPVQLTEDGNTINVPATQTSQADLPTSTLPSSSLTVTATQESDAVPSQAIATTVSGCNDSAQYVTDDGRDGTIYAPNTPFTKMWRIKNTGTCTWDSSYLISYVSGATMTQSPWYMLVPTGSMVAPGDTIDISVGMTSPPEPGDYTANWSIQNSAGTSLAQFYLKLKVLDQASGNTGDDITNVVSQIALEQGNACDPNAIYDVTMNITSARATNVDYRIDLTDSSGQVANGTFSFVDFTSPEAKGSLIFDAAGTRQVVLRVLGPYIYPGQVTVRAYVNGQAWPAVAVPCQ